MKKNTILKITNPILLFLVISQTATAIFRDSLTWKTFSLFHKGGGVLLLILIVIHVALNFRWFKSNYFPK